MSFRINIILISFIVLFALNEVIAQFSWKLNGEAGYFKTNTVEQSIKNDFLALLIGQMKYNYSDTNRQASIIVNLHPEIFGLNNNISLLKVKAEGDYYHFFNDFNLGMNFSILKNNYYGNEFNVKYDILFIQSLFAARIFDKPFNSVLGYTYQNIAYSGERIYDLLYLETQMDQHLSPFFKYGYGSYVETFSIENKFNINPNLNNKNSGWRIGPLVNFKYLKSFLINVEYRFLFHFSQITDTPSYEQWVRIVAGKVFFTDFSIFLLTDLYFRDFSLKESTDNSSALYTPINQENKYYLKLAYEITNRNEIYFRFGYSRENLDELVTNISGWSFTLGFEIR